MTAAEKRAATKRARRRILNSEVKIHADLPKPFYFDPLEANKPWETACAIEYTIGNETIRVPRGFIFDGSSIPAWAWALLLILQFAAWVFGLRWLSRRNWCSPLNTSYLNLYAGNLHDFLWRTTHYGPKTGKRQANTAFESVLVNCGVHWLTARLMYWAVSLAGNETYQRYAAANANRVAARARALAEAKRLNP